MVVNPKNDTLVNDTINDSLYPKEPIEMSVTETGAELIVEAGGSLMLYGSHRE